MGVGADYALKWKIFKVQNNNGKDTDKVFLFNQVLCWIRLSNV